MKRLPTEATLSDEAVPHDPPPDTGLPPSSFADLRNYIASDQHSNWNTRYRMTVVADMGRLIRLDPAAAVLRPVGTAIIPRFRALTPLTTELSKSRIDNLKSSCRAAFKYAARRWAGQRGPRELSPAWQALREKIAGTRDLVMYLSRFAHWCSGQKIEPDQVCDEVLLSYRAYLDDVIGYSVSAVQKLAKRWNLCAATVAGWPRSILTSPSTGKAPCSPKEIQMGKNLLGDYLAYVEFMACGSQPANELDPFRYDDDDKDLDALTDMGIANGSKSSDIMPYAATTIRNRKDVIRRLIGLCNRAAGIPLETMRLRDLVTGKNASLILKLYQREICNDTAHALVNGAHALVVLGRCFIKVDLKSQSALDSYAKNILTKVRKSEKSRAGGMTPKNRARLQQIGPKQMTALLKLPATLIGPVLVRVRAGTAGVSDLVDAQVGAAVAILLHAPIRSQNTVSIKIGTHLTFPSSRGSARLLFPAVETKNGVDLDFNLPIDATQLLRTYVEQILPYFDRSRAGSFLFPGLREGKKGSGLLGSQIRERIQDNVGVVLNQHAFRHLTACLYLRRCPGQYEVVRILLGQKNVATTRKYYCGLEAQAALEHFQKIMASLKENAGVDPEDMTRLVGVPKKTRSRR